MQCSFWSISCNIISSEKLKWLFDVIEWKSVSLIQISKLDEYNILLQTFQYSCALAWQTRKIQSLTVKEQVSSMSTIYMNNWFQC